MVTLINPPGIKTFSGLQMHTPNPPLELAYIAPVIKARGYPTKWFVDRFYTRRRSRKLAETAQR